MLRRDLLKGLTGLVGLSTITSKEEDYYVQYSKTSYHDDNNIKQDCRFPLIQCTGEIKDLYKFKYIV